MEKPRASPARLLSWLTLVAAVSALEYSARFGKSGSGGNTRDEIYRYSTFANGIVFYALIFAVVLAIAFERTDLFALRRPTGRVVALALALLVAVFAWEF